MEIKIAEIASAGKEEQDRLVDLAIGRIFRIMSRPFQDGDVEQYHRCRSIVLTAAEAQGVDTEDQTVGYARDRLKGAAGD